MKKKSILSLILSVILMFTIVFPTGVFADEIESELVEPEVEEIGFELGAEDISVEGSNGQSAQEQTEVDSTTGQIVQEQTEVEELTSPSEASQEEEASEGQADLPEGLTIDDTANGAIEIQIEAEVDEVSGTAANAQQEEEDTSDEAEVVEEADETVEEEAPFVQGYVSVKGGTSVYAAESEQEKIGSFDGNAVVYAVVVSLDDEGAVDWLSISFDTVKAKEAGEAIPSGYIQFKDVTVLSDEETSQLVETLISDDTVRSYEGILLPEAGFKVAETEASDADDEAPLGDEKIVVIEAEEDEVNAEEAYNGGESTPSITRQPESKIAATGTKVTLSVEATGTGLSYQWQYKKKTGSTWSNCSGDSAKTANYQLNVSSVHYGFDFQCVVTDSAGNEATTEIVHIYNPSVLAIVTQPVSQVATTGTKVTMSVVAAGTGLTYQWQYKTKTASAWSNASGNAAKTANWQLNVVDLHYGFDFQCVVKDAAGNEAPTNTVHITPPPLSITKQPESKIAAKNETVTLSVEATGTGLTYQWQYKKKTASVWSDASGSSAKTANYQLKVSDVHFGFDFHCVIKDAAGNEATTDAVNIHNSSVLSIITQPESKIALVGEKVTLSVVATGTGLTYQWQYKKKADSTWTNASGAAAKTANWQLNVSSVHYGFDFHCVIKDVAGNEATTGIVHVSAIEITKQPESQIALKDETVTMSVEATGKTALSYQWQYKKKTGGTWTNTSGASAKTANYQLKVADVHYGFDFQCVITDTAGNKVTTNAVNVNKPPVLSITKQPESKVAAKGEAVTMSVEAAGMGLTYQWQYKKKTATAWSDASGAAAKTANWQLTVAAVHYGFDFQCVIKDASGDKATTDTVNISPIMITKQPESQIASVNKTATLSVEAIGATDLSYQWQYKKKTASAWSNASGAAAKTANYQLNVQNVHYTFDFQCVITDTAGNKVTTDTVNINVPPILSITKQPERKIAAVNDKVTLSVEATGTDLTYQWQYKKKTASTWSDASGAAAKTANWQLTVAAVHYTFDFRCVVTDGEENELTTDTVNIYNPSVLAIITQPESQFASVGDSITLSVEATGTGLTYQWQYKTKTGGTWTNASGASSKTANYQLKVASVHYGFDFRCVVTNSAGNEATTDSVKIYDPSVLAIVTQPVSQTASAGEVITMSVEATGIDLTYQWQYKSRTGIKWTNASGASAKTANYQLTVSAAHFGLDFHCVITDGAGNDVTTDAVNIIHKTAFVIGNVTYEPITTTTCKVASYSGTASSLVIPETVDGMTVTEIGQAAFMDNKYLTSIDLPDTIAFIRAYAFKNCTNLSDMH